jgi:hypothetical protein
MEAFRQVLGQHLQLDPSVRPIECETGLAEDGLSILATVDLSDGACLCASFDLLPGEDFEEDDREFVELSFAFLAEIECGFFTEKLGRDR